MSSDSENRRRLSGEAFHANNATQNQPPPTAHVTLIGQESIGEEQSSATNAPKEEIIVHEEPSQISVWLKNWVENQTKYNSYIFAIAIAFIFFHYLIDHNAVTEVFYSGDMAPEASDSSKVVAEVRGDSERSGAVDFLSVLFKEIGFAGIVAVILNISLEVFNRKRHALQTKETLKAIGNEHAKVREELLENISKSIFQNVYKRNVPELIFSEIEEALLNCNFVRHNWDVTFLIEDVCGPVENVNYNGKDREERGLTKISVTQTYLVEKISDDTAEFTILLGIDFKEQLKETCKLISVKVDDIECSDQMAERPDSEDGAKTFEHRIVFPACNHGSKQTKKIEIKYSKYEFGPYGEQTLNCAYPTTGLVVKALTPSGDYAIGAAAMHRREAEKRASDQYLSTYEMPFGILPGQGLWLSWQKSKPASRAKRSDAT